MWYLWGFSSLIFIPSEDIYPEIQKSIPFLLAFFYMYLYYEYEASNGFNWKPFHFGANIPTYKCLCIYSNIQFATEENIFSEIPLQYSTITESK